MCSSIYLFCFISIYVYSSPIQSPNLPEELRTLAEKVRLKFCKYSSKRELRILGEVFELYADAPEGEEKLLVSSLTCPLCLDCPGHIVETIKSRKGEYDNEPIAIILRNLDVREIKRFKGEPIKMMRTDSYDYLESYWVLHRRLPADPATIKCKATIQLAKEELGMPRGISKMDLDCERCGIFDK